MAIKRKDFQKLSSTVQEFLLKLPDEELSARLRDNLLHALHFLQSYYRVLQNRDKNNDPLQWNIDHSLSPLTPFKEAPDKFEWEWISVESSKARQSLNLQKASAEGLKGLPAVISAIKDDDLNQVKQLIKDDAQCVNSTDLFMRDCLTYAIQFDRLEILKFLLKNGANTNLAASDSSTCLHRAVYNGKADMVQLLLEHKANINVQDSFNRSPLHWSVVRADSLDCLKLLLKYNPSVSVKDRDGLTPAMWACHLDHLEHFKLLSKIDNVNRKIDSISRSELETDNDGRTWIHWSVRKTEPIQCLNFMINSESIFWRDNEGKTCLHAAAEQGALPACKLIISIAGPKIINERDNKKQTPLHLATLNGHARAIKILMDNGADPNLRDATGASSIDYVTKRNLNFCASIIEVCLRTLERKNRIGASSSNSLTSSLNGSESNLTPAPPTTPKNTFTRSFQQLNATTGKDGRPPRPLNNSLSSSITNDAGGNSELIKTAPAAIGSDGGGGVGADGAGLKTMIPSPPPNGTRTQRPNHRGWVSAERVMSGSLRLSRTSTRTSLASDDLDKYMNNTNTLGTMDSFGGSLGNIENILPTIPNGFNGVNSLLNAALVNNNSNNNAAAGNKQSSIMISQPQPQPRTASSSSVNNARMLSGRSQEVGLGLNSGSCETLPSSGHQMPPPVKPRKSSSIASLNNSNLLNNEQTVLQNVSNANKTTTNHFSTSSNDNYTSNNKYTTSLNSKNNLSVEDMSGGEDELSIASVKGEGFASDLSDSEIRNQHQQHQRAKTKRSIGGDAQYQQGQKRPTTPMDVRGYEHQTSTQSQSQQPMPYHHILQQPPQKGSASHSKGVRFHQINDQHAGTGRFNEWDPYSNLNSMRANMQQGERQKSPLKSKQAPSSQPTLQQQTSQQQSNFAHSFFTDSSPRQTSGRSHIGSANVNFASQKHSQMSPQHMANSGGFNSASQAGGGMGGDIVSSSNLDLMVSGQKLGGSRKESSPTNLNNTVTPRDGSQLQSQSLQQQRPFTRRLQPLDKTIHETPIAETTNIPTSASNQVAKNKNAKGTFDRKKLEPIRGLGSSYNSTHSDPGGQKDGGAFNGVHFDFEVNNSGGGGGSNNNVHHFGSNANNNNNNDEEPSISENTASSDKQMMSMRMNRKKILK